MIKGLYSIYDKKACFYVAPFSARNDAEAVRSVTQALRDPNTQLAQHPEDFHLVTIGSFDDNTSEISYSPPHVIVECSALAQEAKPYTLNLTPQTAEIDPPIE